MTSTSQRVALRHLNACAPATLGQRLLAMLRATQSVHWTLHWQAKGASSYSDHLMFEKMYSSVTEEIDGLAEKLVQVHGVGIVAPVPQAIAVAQQIATWAERAAGLGLALQAEQDLQASLRHTRQALDAAGALTLGLDDLLASVANTHETHLYLLQQRLESPLVKQAHTVPRGYRFIREDTEGRPVFMDGDEGKVGTRMVTKWGPHWGLWELTTRGWSRLDDPFDRKSSPQAAADATTSWRQAAIAPDMSAEAHFFDTPRANEVREFAISKALSNDMDVSRRALQDGEGNHALQRAVDKSPPTVAEVLDDTPGSQDFSTLSRYLVLTEHPTDPDVPRGHHDVSKHPIIR